MQLQRALPGVEHPAEVMAEMPGDVLDGDLRHQVEVEFRAQPGQPPGQDLRPLVRVQAVQFPGQAGVSERGQIRILVPGRRGARQLAAGPSRRDQVSLRVCHQLLYACAEAPAMTSPLGC